MKCENSLVGGLQFAIDIYKRIDNFWSKHREKKTTKLIEKTNNDRQKKNVIKQSTYLGQGCYGGNLF